MEAALKKEFEEQVHYSVVVNAGAPFSDPEFPPNSKSLGSGDEMRDIVKAGIEWKHAGEVFRHKVEVFSGISINDVIQEDLGNCYFLSAISGLAEFPNRVERIFLTKGANSSGCYALRIYVCGVPRTIMLDDMFPYMPSQRRWAFTHSKGDEMWVMLLEKAWAKIHKAYENIIGGDSREALAALTGGPTYLYLHEKTPKNELWEIINSADKNNYIMTTGGKKKIKGIESSHSYSLINAVEVELERGRTEKLVQIRNPWGCYEWQGDWCDTSPLWTPELRQRMHQDIADDGCFCMKFDDFYCIYAHTLLCKCIDHYIRSSVVVYEYEACVAFQLPTPVKGFFTINHLTTRFGKLLDKDYTQKVLVCELFRFTKSNFVSAIQPRGSDSVGVACHEADLDSGIYLMHGYYLNDKPRVKFMNFAAYADKEVELVVLPGITSVNKVTIDVVKNAFAHNENMKARVPMPRVVKPPPSFTYCCNNHPLLFNTEPYNSARYRCDTCKQERNVADGRYSCKQCMYDVCTVCRPAPGQTSPSTQPGGAVAPIPQRGASKVPGASAFGTAEDRKDQSSPAVEKAPETFSACKQNHKLEYKNNPERASDEFLCDNCGKVFAYTMMHWRCDACDYDICVACHPPPKESVVAVPTVGQEVAAAVNTCSRGHMLKFEVYMYQGGFYRCDICGRTGDCMSRRWLCSHCNFNICTFCKHAPATAHVDVSVVPDSVIITSVTACEKGHKLFYSSYSYFSGEYFCNKCLTKGKCKEGRWFCLMCEYDICPNCRTPPVMGEGEAKMCDNQHYMTYSTMPYPYGSFYRCDRCRKAYPTEKGRWWCSICGFDICQKCAANEITEDASRPAKAPIEDKDRWCKPESSHWFVRVIPAEDEYRQCSICENLLTNSKTELNYQCGRCGILYCAECAKKAQQRITAEKQAAAPIPVPASAYYLPAADLGNEQMVLPMPQSVYAYPAYSTSPAHQDQEQHSRSVIQRGQVPAGSAGGKKKEDEEGGIACCRTGDCKLL